MCDAEAWSPGICVRSNRVIGMESTEIKDPKVETLAAMAVRDTAYMRDVDHIERQTELDKASELRQLRACWDDLSVICLDRGKLLIRGDREILIPKEGRQLLVDQLHATHLSYQGIRNLARNKFFWPGMASTLEKKYLGCQECKTNSVSHHDKPVQVVPEGLNMLAPGNRFL